MMKDFKLIVKEKYATIANQSKTKNQGSCCGCSPDGNKVDYTIFSENYSELKGYNSDADLSLGCGLPTQFANIKKGDSVLDLGSGAGNDCFVARAETGSKGKVTGIDFTDEMISKARINNKKLGFENVEFIKGDIDNMPLPDNYYDVIVSNCVLNLVPDKKKAFSEIYRVTKPGGHFSISDVVVTGNLPDQIRKDAEMYAGCVAGAIEKTTYLEIVKKAGFTNLQIQKEKEITLPDEILLNYLSEEKLKEYKNSDIGIFSITLKARK